MSSANIRFNAPIFSALAAWSAPQTAAAVAVWHRPARRRDRPMASSRRRPGRLGVADGAVARGAPVVYPWYLIYLTPFLFVRATLPLTVWTFTSFGTYIVWYQARHGGRWIVPAWVIAIEFGLLIAATVAVAVTNSRARRPRTFPP